jgi:acyl transferase domain-containing protein
MSDDVRALMQEALRELRRSKARIAELERGAAAAATPLPIVGLGCKLPRGIDDPAAAWRFFAAGGDAIGPAPTDRWPASDAPQPVPPGAFLDAPFDFDAAWFRMAPREARLVDPQQRVLLELAHATFEHAGVAPRSLHGSDTGVFVGISTDDWALAIARHLPFAAIDGSIGPGGNACGAAGRVSFAFGLEGPSFAVNTACSSSLVALHLARQALLRGECELALVLGVNLMLSPLPFAVFQRANMLSPDGRCHTFGAAAAGYGRGEGAVALLLATPAAAQRRGLTTQALLLGSACNQDGATAGLTVPSGPAQQRVLRAALRDAGLAASAVQYVEAHGTGTMLGDPIELQALAAVYGEGRAADAPFHVGSAKTNFGHLEAAAGLLGVLKVVLQLQHRQFAPHLHATPRNPHLPWDRLPLRVPEQLCAWPATERRVAGISSFGFTGTNAHALVAAAPAVAAGSAAASQVPAVLPLAARTPPALRELCRRWAHAVAAPEVALAAAVATAALGRSPDRVRIAALVDEREGLVRRLLAAAAGEPCAGLWTGSVGHGEPPVFDATMMSSPEDLAQAWVRGVVVPWERVVAASAQRIALPTYPFQRRPWRLPGAEFAAPLAVAPAELRSRLAVAANAERAALLTTHVQRVAAAVLQLAVDDIDVDGPLADHGFDSMRAVELASRLEADLGVPVPFVAMADGASARDLAAALASSWPDTGAG